MGVSFAVFLDISLYICLCMLQTHIFGSVIGSIIPSYLASGLELNWTIEKFSFWPLVTQC